MKGLVHHNNFWAANAFVVPIKPSQLDTGFIGFATGIAKKHLIHARDSAQLIGQGVLFGNLVDIRYVYELGGLLTNSRNQFRVRMAQAIYRNPGQGVQVFFPSRVPQPHPLTFGKGDRLTHIGVH